MPKISTPLKAASPPPAPAPGAAARAGACFAETGFCISGPIQVVNLPKYHDFVDLRQTPAQVRAELEALAQPLGQLHDLRRAAHREVHGGVHVVPSAGSTAVLIFAPHRRIAENAGWDGAVVVSKILEGKGAFGFNARTEKYEDLLAAGVIDPAKVTRSALVNAASIAGLFLTTEAVVADKPEKTPVAAGAAGSTGLGEMNIKTCGGFLTVEFMRNGATPEQDAKNRKLRQALSIAIDWEEYSRIFPEDAGETAMGPVPPGIFGSREDGSGRAIP